MMKKGIALIMILVSAQSAFAWGLPTWLGGKSKTQEEIQQEEVQKEELAVFMRDFLCKSFDEGFYNRIVLMKDGFDMEWVLKNYPSLQVASALQRRILADTEDAKNMKDLLKSACFIGSLLGFLTRLGVEKSYPKKIKSYEAFFKTDEGRGCKVFVFSKVLSGVSSRGDLVGESPERVFAIRAICILKIATKAIEQQEGL